MQEFNLTLNLEQLRVVRQALTFATGIGNLSVQDTQYSNEVYLKLDRAKPIFNYQGKEWDAARAIVRECISEKAQDPSVD